MAKINYYVDNKRLYADMVENWYPAVKAWKDSGSKGDPPPVTNYMGDCIYKIASKYCFSRNFFHLKHIHDDLAAYACLITLKYIHNFDPTKYRNPFAYITMIVGNAYIQYIKKETKNNKAKSAFVERSYLEQMSTDQTGENFVTFLQDKMDQSALDDQRFDSTKKSIQEAEDD